jgi:hypothetical protein
MSSSYDQAVTALYQAPHGSFVAERQRLSSELKAAGDPAAATRLSKLARPSISAWAVNQLWWHARTAFEDMLATAQQLRTGELAARGAHRQAVAKLSTRARELLSEGGHAASEATLRRVEATLAGLAAAGGFEPDPPGALSKDRDPPGFEALGGAEWAASATPASDPEKTSPASHPATQPQPDGRELAEAQRREELESQRAREQALAEQKRVAEERAQQQALARRLATELRDAQQELATAERERERIARELVAAEREVERVRALVAAAEALLADAEAAAEKS